MTQVQRDYLPVPLRKKAPFTQNALWDFLTGLNDLSDEHVSQSMVNIFTEVLKHMFLDLYFT